MKLEPLGSLYHALYILQGPLAIFVKKRLGGRPKWFDELKVAVKKDNNSYNPDDDDIAVSTRAIDYFWQEFKRTFDHNTIKREDFARLRVVRNRVAHIREDQLTHADRIWAFGFIYNLLLVIGDHPAADDVAFLFKGFKKGAYITGRQGSFCRACGKKLSTHKRPCASKHESDREKDKIGEYCAFCGQKCVIDETIVFSATCSNTDCINFNEGRLVDNT